MKQSSISFFGNTYTAHGIKPDPEKIRDIVNMPTPQTKEQLHSFIGYMTHLSQFIPNFADKGQTLRDLPKEYRPWVWHVKIINSILSLSPVLPEILWRKKTCLTLSGCLSTGPGSCSSPRCWPSRICIESAHWEPVWLQQHWTWTIVGRAWCRTLPPLPVCATIHSHHRPQTFGDHMPQALPRLQRLMLRIQGYNYCIEYRPGRDMLLADTLSRMPNPENKEEIPLDLRVDHIDICLINFASKKQQQLLEEMPATQFCRNWSRWFMPDGQQPSKNCRWTYCHTGHSAMSCAQNLVSSARDDKSSSRPVWRQTSCNSNTLATRGSAKPNAGHATLFTGLISTRRLNGCGSRVKCARNTRKSNARHLCSPIPHRLDRGNPYLQTFSQ